MNPPIHPPPTLKALAHDAEDRAHAWRQFARTPNPDPRVRSQALIIGDLYSAIRHATLALSEIATQWQTGPRMPTDTDTA